MIGYQPSLQLKPLLVQFPIPSMDRRGTCHKP